MGTSIWARATTTSFFYHIAFYHVISAEVGGLFLCTVAAVRNDLSPDHISSACFVTHVQYLPHNGVGFLCLHFCQVCPERRDFRAERRNPLVSISLRLLGGKPSWVTVQSRLSECLISTGYLSSINSSVSIRGCICRMRFQTKAGFHNTHLTSGEGSSEHFAPEVIFTGRPLSV